LGLRGGALRAQRTGLLFLEYDLGERKAAAAAGVRQAAWQFSAFLLGLALLLWLLLYAMLTRRVRRIVATMRRVAEADFSARTGITGRDEVARIAQAFDTMTASLGDARMQLQHERDHLEEEVAARTAELSRANQELEAFSYSASHDLQAPLRAMRGFAGVLLEDYADRLDEGGRDSLERIDRASLRMSQMVEDLLAFARSTRTALHRTPVDLSERATEIVEELRERDKRRSFEASIQPGVTAVADPSLMQSVLANLLGNAWKYSRESESSCIEFGAVTVDGETVYFVRDNGVGFDMEEAARIFEPFQRLHRQDRFEGTGIGLATVWRIVQRHGGRLWAEAETGKGATFRFTLGSAD
jgi:light-regulated signal transduction histidine kinase (bacteriophytochrome)